MKLSLDAIDVGRLPMERMAPDLSDNAGDPGRSRRDNQLYLEAGPLERDDTSSIVITLHISVSGQSALANTLGFNRPGFHTPRVLNASSLKRLGY